MTNFENIILKIYKNISSSELMKETIVFLKASRFFICFSVHWSFCYYILLTILIRIFLKNIIFLEYGSLSPGPQIWNLSNFFRFCGKVSRFRFQRALNHPQTLSLSQVMQENVILVIMPKYGRSAPSSQNGIFQKIFIFLKRSSNFASNVPSTTCRHKV